MMLSAWRRTMRLAAQGAHGFESSPVVEDEFVADKRACESPVVDI